MTKAVSDVKETVRHHFSEIMNHGRVDKFEDVWTDNCVIKGLQGRSFKGTRGVKKRILDFRKAVPDLKVKVDDVLAEGNKVVATWEMSGTFKHDYNGIKGTGKKFNVRGVDLFKINKGKIQENSLYFDLFGLLHQIDAI
ncbi:MAG: ester cyclase [Candidatus Nitrosopolaris sp.]